MNAEDQSPERHVALAIRGRVQGVGYRAWTCRQAELHGLSGSVRNRRDGTVEAVLSGPAEAVARMIAACRQGPRGAQVTEVVVAERTQAPEPGFRHLPTD